MPTDSYYCSVTQSCPTLCDHMDAVPQAALSFPVSQSLLKLMSIESMIASNHLILCCPFLLMPSIFPSIGVFSSELYLCPRWPKDWSFSFSIGHSKEYSGLISFRIDWLDFLAVKVNLKSSLQHHSSKVLIFETLILKPQLKILTYLLKKIIVIYSGAMGFPHKLSW